jgi:hypothetical protein
MMARRHVFFLKAFAGEEVVGVDFVFLVKVLQ